MKKGMRVHSDWVAQELNVPFSLTATHSLELALDFRAEFVKGP
jgi:hypothetical protein